MASHHAPFVWASLSLLLLLTNPSPGQAGRGPSFRKGQCNKGSLSPSGIPRPWSNGTRVLATAGWARGRFEDYFSKAHGRSFVERLWNVDAYECYQIAMCKQLVQRKNIGFISWQAKWSKGTRGQCFLFAEETCTPLYNPGLSPYIFDTPDWYSTSIKQPVNNEFTNQVLDNMDCDKLLSQTWHVRK